MLWRCDLFFMLRDKANERTGYLTVSDHRCQRLRVAPDGVQVRCQSLRWRQTCFLKVLMSYRPGNTAAGRPFHSPHEKKQILTFFFSERGKRSSGSLVWSEIDSLPASRWRQYFLKVSLSYRSGNTAADCPFHSCVKEVSTKPHSSGVPRFQMEWMVFEFVTYCAVSKIDSR